jgi:probable HAF family extracellular repeat protein
VLAVVPNSELHLPAGQTGKSEMKSSARRAIRSGIAALALSLGASAQAAVLYTVTDLGLLGGTYASGFAINNNGQVAGISDTPIGERAFLYNGGVITNLGMLGGPGGRSRGLGINNSGSVVGDSNTAFGSIHAFLYSNGVMSDLGTLGGTSSFGQGINDSGQVTGYSDITGSSLSHAFLYSGGVMSDLGTLGGAVSLGHAINSLGQVTGESLLPNNANHAFLYRGGVMNDLGTLGGFSSYGRGINTAGQVAGFSETASGGIHAFLYAGGAMNDLGTLGGSDSFAYAINSSGQVVGFSYMADNLGYNAPAFLYSGGVMSDLNGLIDPQSGWFLQRAFAINDSGQITGTGSFNNRPRAFLLTPITTSTGVPEPATWAMMFAGFSLMGGALRRGKVRTRVRLSD